MDNRSSDRSRTRQGAVLSKARLVYTGLGDKEHAFEWFDRAYAERSPWLVTLKVKPLLDSIRSDPRFGALVTKMGLSGQ